MTHRISKVKALDNCMLSVVFQNGAEKEYDMCKLYPAFPQFKEFEKNKKLFQQVKVDVGGYGISWNDELDLLAEEIWENGIATGKVHEMGVKTIVAEKLIYARSKTNMTQSELAEVTGIYQADISKIERGLANPSIVTLERLAQGLGMKLSIDFL